MQQPGPTMHKRQAAHPIGVVVEHQEIKRTRLPFQQRKSDMMKIPGTIQSQPGGVIRSASQNNRERSVKLFESAKTTSHANNGPPVLKWKHPKGKLFEEFRLPDQTTVKIQNPQVHANFPCLPRLSDMVSPELPLHNLPAVPANQFLQFRPIA